MNTQTSPVVVTSPPMADAIARKFVAMGAHVIFFPRGTKACKTPNWEVSATNDIEAALDWAAQDPYQNVGLVGKQDGVWGLDDDAGLLDEYIQQFGELNTYGTNTVSGGRHYIFRQNAASWAMGNISIKDEQNRELLSARIDDRYVVAAGSWAYPDNDESLPLTQYTAINPAAPIMEAPDSLLEFIKTKDAEWNAKKQKPSVSTESGVQVHEGGRNNYLTSRGGKLREAGASHDSILTELRRMNEDECVPPLPDREVKSIAASVSKYKEGTPPLVLNQRSAATATDDAIEVPIDTSAAATRPLFPVWAIEGTSIYDGLVKPALETSSKHAEFLFFPAMQVMMNYMSGKVTIGMQTTRLNFFIGLISPYGQYFKSTSCDLAHEYSKLAGICGVSNPAMQIAGDIVLIAQAGSPEGFGLSMRKKQATQAIMFNDELGKFVSKAGIEGSAFASDVLSWYGAAYFGNNVTTAKNNFQFDAGTYTFGWLWCTTDRGFNRHWPKIAEMSSGLEDRMIFVVGPDKPKPAAPFVNPPLDGALRTRQFIEAAIQQKTFQFADTKGYAGAVAGLDPRSMELVQKLALYFAVDLGRTEIDSDCVRRARALVDYRNQAREFVAPIEADNVEGRLQKEVIRELRQHGGKMPHRDLCRNLDYARYGTSVWRKAFYGLVNDGTIAQFQESRTPGKRKTEMVGLLKRDD